MCTWRVVIASWNSSLLGFNIKQDRYIIFFYSKNAVLYVTSLLGNRSSTLTFLLSPVKELFFKKGLRQLFKTLVTPAEFKFFLNWECGRELWLSRCPPKGLYSLLLIFCVIYTVNSGLKKKKDWLSILSLLYSSFSLQNSVAGDLWIHDVGTPKNLQNCGYFHRYKCCYFKTLRHKIYKSPCSVPPRKDENRPFGAIPNAPGMHVY